MNNEIEFKPTNYPSDLTDAQWGRIAEYLPQGPNSDHHKRSLVDAVFYLVENGCKWRALPHDYPPYSTVHTFYRRARISGLWEKILQATVEKTRVEAGRTPEPTYGLIDSQSVKTVYASEERGIDGGKKRRGESDISSRT
jgi:putative transposase